MLAEGAGTGCDQATIPCDGGAHQCDRLDDGGQSVRGNRAFGGMQYRTLGRTGAKVSLIGIGGYHIGQPKDPRDGIAIVRTAIDNGVTFMDNRGITISATAS